MTSGGQNQTPPDPKSTRTKHTGGSGSRADSAGWMKFAGLGVELAGTTLGMAAIGYAVDAYAENERPLATALGTLIGFTFAMYRFVRTVTQR